MAGKECAANAEGTSTRDGLGDCDLFTPIQQILLGIHAKDESHRTLFEGSAVFAVGQFGSVFVEFCQTSDGKIFLVGNNAFLGLDAVASATSIAGNRS